MEIRPIFSAMMRNRTGAILIALQIAVALAIIVNAFHMIYERLKFIDRPNGMDSDNIIVVRTQGLSDTFDPRVSVRDDIETISKIPGVLHVAYADAIPLSGSGSRHSLYASPEEDGHGVSVNYFSVNHNAAAALGVELLAGRTFLPTEIVWEDPADNTSRSSFSSQAIVTQAAAEKLFPDDTAVGKLVYNNLGAAAEIVGVIKHMHGSWVNWNSLDQVAFYPVIPADSQPRFLVRVAPGTLDGLIPQIEQALQRDRTRILREVTPMSDIIAKSYQSDRSMAILLMVVIVLLLAVTVLGIVGLASFSVRQRTKQIGTRRAIGALRYHILRYFMIENWLMTTIGVAIGTLLAIMLNYWLVSTFAMPKLNIVHIPLCILGAWSLGLIAVLGPAYRASNISPAVATRTV